MKYFFSVIFSLAFCFSLQAQVIPEHMKKRKGLVRIYYPNIENQIKSEGEVNRHLKNGCWLSYDEAGEIEKKEFYVNGLRNGSYTTYNHAGKTLITGNYLNDKVFGEWEYFSDSGNVLKILHYDSLGQKLGLQETFYDNGAIETYILVDKEGNEKG